MMQLLPVCCLQLRHGCSACCIALCDAAVACSAFCLQLLNGSNNRLLQGQDHTAPQQLQQQHKLQKQLQQLAESGSLPPNLLPQAAALMGVPEPLPALQLHGRSAAAAAAAGIDGTGMLAGQLPGLSSMLTGGDSDPLDPRQQQGSLLTEADDVLMPEVTSVAAAAAAGQLGSSRAAAAVTAAVPAGVASRGCVHSLNMRWLMQQLPRGCILESIMTGMAGMCGVLYTLPQQQQQQSLLQAVPAGAAALGAAVAPWYAVVWDGLGWHRVGTYDCEADAAEACNYVLDLAADCADGADDGDDADSE
jgi:hypothetical protein